ncbi:YczE/YyaS/YitT family protein [Pseudalkalibacillus hwajinpoensis]|uniref:YczE/YyaS/YitT family protein n=1 Tax=Guptibacillus hwajinpoensis TaxID=208199 RepID=UPI001CD217E6|nr:YitT family protein [Pseudalkalibacillus hwajinpoensis]MCA0991993.1 YitT family protein [Pseudalkalibacillus hwajinpoensis]
MRNKIIRWGFFFVGLAVLGLGIAMTIKGKTFGIGPWDVFHYGLFKQFGLTIGSWSIITGFIILAFTSLYTKTMPQLGAFLNMLLLGLFIDFFLYLLPDPVTLLSQGIVFIVGIVVLGYGIGLYVISGLGAGPRDGIMLLIVEKTGWRIDWVRNGIEIAVLLFGWLLGGPVGIGSIVIAFMLGKIIQFSMPQCKALLETVLTYQKPMSSNESA